MIHEGVDVHHDDQRQKKGKRKARLLMVGSSYGLLIDLFPVYSNSHILNAGDYNAKKSKMKKVSDHNPYFTVA